MGNALTGSGYLFFFSSSEVQGGASLPACLIVPKAITWIFLWLKTITFFYKNVFLVLICSGLWFPCRYRMGSLFNMRLEKDFKTSIIFKENRLNWYTSEPRVKMKPKEAYFGNLRSTVLTFNYQIKRLITHIKIPNSGLFLSNNPTSRIFQI